MMNPLVYATIAVLVVLAVAVLARRGRAEPPPAPDVEEGFRGELASGSLWSLGERIFDSSDYFWLRDELRRPHLARVLIRHRQQLALCWLKALRFSFQDLVRTPVDSAGSAPAGSHGWRLLWLTFRFQFGLGYALLIVRLFGPYAPLVPSAGWARALLTTAFHQGRIRFANLRHPL